MVSPVDTHVEVPIIDKRGGQVIAVTDNIIQIMDLETFETFETSSIDDEIRDKITQGVEVEYWKVMDKIKVVRVKGSQ
jgi:translation initiation factor 5A